MRPVIVRLLAFAACGAIPIAVFLQLPMGTWADLGGLPNHPLVVHLVVVLVPVVGIWAILAAWRPGVLTASFPYLYALTVVGALASIVAKSSGDSLAAAVGLPKEHAAAGDRMVSLTIALAGVVLLLGALARLRAPRPAMLAAQVLVTAVGVATLPLTYLAGHTGAQATWEDTYAEAKAPISTESDVFTMSDVERHNTRADCWTVVDGTVYDVTSFVDRHPAGTEDIIEMCGTDASEDFLGQHSGQGEPERWLATLKVGTLAG